MARNFGGPTDQHGHDDLETALRESTGELGLLRQTGCQTDKHFGRVIRIWDSDYASHGLKPGTE